MVKVLMLLVLQPFIRSVTAILTKCHLRIKSEPFLADLKFKSELL